MGHLLYLMFRCDFDVMESLKEFGEVNTAPGWIRAVLCRSELRCAAPDSCSFCADSRPRLCLVPPIPPNFSSYRNHIETLNIANNVCIEH